MPVEFSLKSLYVTMVGKICHFYDVHISRKCIESMHFHTWPRPQSKLSPKFLSHPLSRQKVITNFPHAAFFRKSVSSTTERGGGNYDLLYQNSIRKYGDGLEH